MVFTERMILESPSSSFEFGGRVNLRSEALDNEMIVTLPVSNSLPWYAAYLALANPVAHVIPEAVQRVEEASYLSEQDKLNILRDNARRLFGLNKLLPK